MRLARLAFALVLTIFVAAAAAQPYPARGIRLIVDTSPGGGSPESTAGRLRGDHRLWGQVIREAGIRLE